MRIEACGSAAQRSGAGDRVCGCRAGAGWEAAAGTAAEAFLELSLRLFLVGIVVCAINNRKYEICGARQLMLADITNYTVHCALQ